MIPLYRLFQERRYGAWSQNNGAPEMEMNRRSLIASASLLPILGLPGCAGGGALSLTEAIRRLLSLASQRAFASLIQENGFFSDALTRISLPDAIGGQRTSGILATLLSSAPVRDRMLRQVNRAAEKGASLAAPIVADAIRSASFDDALALVRGGPTAATDFLKGRMGNALTSAMPGGIADGLRLFDSAVVTDVLKHATGINFAALRDDVTVKASDAIYRAIGREETAIRANPQATGDPLLTAVFALAR
jgi:hypothetical protein